MSDLSFIENFLISGIAAVMSQTAVAPLERMKLLIQNQEAMIKSGRLKKPFKSNWDCAIRTSKHEGVLAFWRGNFTNCVRYFPTQALNFAFKDKIQKKLLDHPDKNEESYVTLLRNILAGALAGGMTSCCVYSLDYARTRLANDIIRNQSPVIRRNNIHTQPEILNEISGPKLPETNLDSTNEIKGNKAKQNYEIFKAETTSSENTEKSNSTNREQAYKKLEKIAGKWESSTFHRRQFKGIIDVYRQTLASDGVIGLYRGFYISLVGIAVYRGFYFGLYDTIIPLVSEEQDTLFIRFSVGYLITVFSNLLTYPIDTVRRRMMMTSGEPDKFTSSLQVFRFIAKNEGYSGFLKGASINALRSIAGAGVLIGTDYLKPLYTSLKKDW